MPSRAPSPSSSKPGFHRRSRHASNYDFAALIEASPALAPFVVVNPVGTPTIPFFDPEAVKALNRALLMKDYRITDWDIPPGYLCPPIPGRAEYLHHVADLLSESRDEHIPRGAGVRILDIGIGANAVYPIIGLAEYGWSFVGSDIDRVAVNWVRQLANKNSILVGKLECRLQPFARDSFRGVVRPGEKFAASICNPPFHDSPATAAEGSQRKLRNLGAKKSDRSVLNFGGGATELWCEGGELGFIQRMIAQSAEIPNACHWFTTLVSKGSNLRAIERGLLAASAATVRVIELSQGQKQSRIVAWRF